MAHAVADADLLAYADGQLDPARAAEVETLVAADPEAAARVAAYRAQDEALRALFGSADDAPLPAEAEALAARLAARLEERSHAAGTRAEWWHRPALLQMAAAVALVVAGVAGGWYGANVIDADQAAAPAPVRVAQTPPAQPAPPAPLHNFAAAGVRAFDLYAVDSPFAVELGEEERETFDGWVTRRMGKPVFAPDLSGAGFRMIGGRALPTASGPSAQYMYEDDAGWRLTLYVSGPRGTADVPHGVYTQGESVAVYWQDQGLAYALIGFLDPDRMVEIAAELRPRILEERSRRAQPAAPPQQQAPAQVQPASTGTTVR
jgi:anti-sigma factor RsiW